jgi:hypothetical protein
MLAQKPARKRTESNRRSCQTRRKGRNGFPSCGPCHEREALMEIRRSLAILLICSTLAYTKGNTFSVRYNGGSVASKVKPDDWGNKLTITPENLTLIFHDKLPKSKEHVSLVIPTKTVTGLSYGQEAHRRVGTMVVLAVLLTPLALFGLFHKTRLHYIGIQYRTVEGTSGGILLQGDKSDYRSLVVALQGVTGLPVAVSDKEREFIPVGVTLSVTAEPTKADLPQAEPATKTGESSPVPPTGTPATVAIESTPASAGIYVDGQFLGNSPFTLSLSPGKHSVTVKMSGFRDWTLELTATGGSEARLNASLVKIE